VAFRPCLTAGLALSCFLILLPELYVKRLFLVNGTAWYKAEKSWKKGASWQFHKFKISFKNPAANGAFGNTRCFQIMFADCFLKYARQAAL
jgi:hypothetical protein